MTHRDDEVPHNPMNEIEMVAAMLGLAKALRVFFLQLIEEGFSAEEAIHLTTTWLFGTAGGKQL